MKFLITGASGQLGYDINLELKKRGFSNILTPSSTDMDITDEKQVKDVILTYKPDIIFHCAAYTAVDKAESEKELCYSVNVKGTKNIVKYANEVGAKVIYFSTDYVFDGKKVGKYKSEDKPCPINYYGLTKYFGEEEVKKNNNYLIARISWVFGINGNNFIKTMIRLGRTKEYLNVIDDQIGSPTYTKDLANLVVDMAIKNINGIFNITNEGFCSWNEFAKEIMKINNINIDINSISTEKYNAVARRPLNSKLDKNKLEESGFSRLPSWQDALERFMVEYNEQGEK